MKHPVAIVIILLAAAALGLYLLLRESSPPPPDPGKERRFWEDEALLTALGRSGKRGLAGITVVAPASGLHGENVEKARGMAASMGLRLPGEAMNPEAVPYNANHDDIRLKLFIDAVGDPEAEVLWALRGGYGSSRLLPALARLDAPARPKIFVGYSDMTFLHLFFQKWGWRTVHGPMFWELSFAEGEKRESNFLALASLLAGDDGELRYPGLRPLNKAAEEWAGTIAPGVVGGNLTCLAAAVGTPWAVETAGKILLLEDVKEKGYKIDRMLTQLRAAGAFERAAAILLGSFTRGDEFTEYSLERFARDCPRPVFRGDCFGHGEVNLPIVFNTPAAIEREEEKEGEEPRFLLRIPLEDFPETADSSAAASETPGETRK